MRLPPLAAAISLALAGAALAHSGVQNTRVKAWMDNMETIAAETKTLGHMTRGITPFDRDAAQAALTRLGEEASEIPALFATPASDPKSEARRLIWEEPELFAEKAAALQAAAEAEIRTVEDLRAAFRSIAETCKSCHSRYRR